MYYGLVGDKPQAQIWEVAFNVCMVLGSGANKVAEVFLCEIAAQETHSGTLRDRHATSMGTGLNQIERISFDNIMARTRDEVWDTIRFHFGIERNLNYEMLAYSPLLSMIFARLHLRLIPEEIPADIEGRAAYWKKYYNTEAGAGTVEDYLKNCKAHL